jgi:hypothetical protein
MNFLRNARYSLITGAILLAGGIWFSISPLALIVHGASATATVAYIEVENGKSKLQYYAHVAYLDSHETRQVAELPESDNPNAFAKGQRVPIVYDPSNPSEVASANAIWLPLAIPGSLAVIGFVLFVSGLVRLPGLHRRRVSSDSANPST